MKWNAALADIVHRATALHQQRSKTHDFHHVKYLLWLLIVQSVWIGEQSTVHPDREMHIYMSILQKLPSARRSTCSATRVMTTNAFYWLMEGNEKKKRIKWIPNGSTLRPFVKPISRLAGAVSDSTKTTLMSTVLMPWIKVVNRDKRSSEQRVRQQWHGRDQLKNLWFTLFEIVPSQWVRAYAFYACIVSRQKNNTTMTRFETRKMMKNGKGNAIHQLKKKNLTQCRDLYLPREVCMWHKYMVKYSVKEWKNHNDEVDDDEVDDDDGGSKHRHTIKKRSSV